jgi:hypothetical protein
MKCPPDPKQMKYRQPSRKKCSLVPSAAPEQIALEKVVQALKGGRQFRLVNVSEKRNLRL